MAEPTSSPIGAPPSGWKTYVLLSILLLAPVYWQPRLQAGDISSHIYNSWTSQWIETGRTQGLVNVYQTTNVLFDLMVSALFRLGGAEFAQRVSVSVAVLIFVWGAFRFIAVVSGRRPWHMIASVAMLAYGWVFHMGFFNFYLSMGLCLWALSLAWNSTPRRLALAGPLLVLAYVAHALPVVWAAGLCVYQLVANRLSAHARAYVTAGWFVAMVVVNFVIGKATFTRWTPQQMKMATGADQVWVFDGKYYFVLLGLLVVWGLLFLDLVKLRGAREVVTSIPFQFCAISASAVCILPTTVQLPGFNHSLVYIAERMSLGVGVCVCAVLAAGVPRRFERYALIAVAVLFFGFLYRDERVLNAAEDRMESALERGGSYVESNGR
jgi:hypothetical protein